MLIKGDIFPHFCNYLIQNILKKISLKNLYNGQNKIQKISCKISHNYFLE